MSRSGLSGTTHQGRSSSSSYSNHSFTRQDTCPFGSFVWHPVHLQRKGSRTPAIKGLPYTCNKPKGLRAQDWGLMTEILAPTEDLFNPLSSPPKSTFPSQPFPSHHQNPSSLTKTKNPHVSYSYLIRHSATMQFSTTLLQFLYGLALLGVATGSPIATPGNLKPRDDCRDVCNDNESICSIVADPHVTLVPAFGNYIPW